LYHRAIRNALQLPNYLAQHVILSRWLAFLGTYRTLCVAPDSAFRRVFEELRRMRLAA
jgi:hypothetical protein